MLVALAILASLLVTTPRDGRSPAALASGLWTGVPVFMYHMVDPVVPKDPVGNDLTVTPEQFEAQLRYLAAHHVRLITAKELVAELERGERPAHAAVLTFDDGYADNALYALPLLRKYGAKATFFIITGTVGAPRHLTWKQIRALRDAGMEIAAHGERHVDLTGLPAAGQQAIASECVVRLRRFAGNRPLTYAYPAGEYNAGTLTVMRKLAMEAAFTTRPGYVTSLEHRYELPRFRVHHVGAESFFTAFFGERVRTAHRPSQVDVNAATRAAGNRKSDAVALGRILLATPWPAQVLKVRIEGAMDHEVAGLVVAGSKFHRPLSRAGFTSEVVRLIELSFAHSRVDEVDVWAVVPFSEPVGVAVSGDLAQPTTKIVFSVTVTRSAAAGGVQRLVARDAAFWDPAWEKTLAAGPR